MKRSARDKRIDKMVKHISKVVVENIVNDEDMANQTAYNLTRTMPNPEYLDDFMEAWSIVETKIKKALGVK